MTNSSETIQDQRPQSHEDGTTFRGRSGPIKVPAHLADIVEGVFGLDNRPQVQPRFMPFHSAHSARMASMVPPNSFNPNDLAAIYNFPAGAGTGECVGIIELGGGYQAADLQNYFTSLGITSEVQDRRLFRSEHRQRFLGCHHGRRARQGKCAVGDQH
jgi:kumamolisin